LKQSITLGTKIPYPSQWSTGGQGADQGATGSGSGGSIYIDVSNQNNQLNYNNAGSSGGGSSGGGSSSTTATSDSYNTQTTTTTNNYYNQTEAGAPVEPEVVTTTTTKTKKAKDVTYFTFLGGKTHSNTSGKITPSKYITEEAFRNAAPDDVIVEARSESEGEAGRSSQTLTKQDLFDAVAAGVED
jgi:hypothetical protein